MRAFELMEGFVAVRMQPEQMSSIIVLPDVLQARPMRGEIIALGPCMRTPQGTVIDFPVEVGDSVVYPPYAVEISYKEGDQEVGIIRAADLMAVEK
jgi:chaperonin GroES